MARIILIREKLKILVMLKIRRRNLKLRKVVRMVRLEHLNPNPTWTICRTNFLVRKLDRSNSSLSGILNRRASNWQTTKQTSQSSRRRCSLKVTLSQQNLTWSQNNFRRFLVSKDDLQLSINLIISERITILTLLTRLVSWTKLCLTRAASTYLASNPLPAKPQTNWASTQVLNSQSMTSKIIAAYQAQLLK